MKRKLLLSLILLGFMTPIWAHKINLFVNIEGDQAEVMGYFADGKTPKQTPITVFDQADNLLLEGETNDDGEFAFALPKKEGSLKVVIDAGMGHKAEYIISEEELREEGLSEDAQADVSGESARDSLSSTATSAAVGNRQLRRMIETAVAKANRPLMLKLDQAQKKASLSDILGGIGLILGALGLWFFLQAKKLQPKKPEAGTQD